MNRRKIMYRCVLFDMDGTLINSYDGIFHAYQYTLKKMNTSFGGDVFVRRAIGAPLPFIFKHVCGMDDSEVPKAIQHYRHYYSEKGKQELKVYDGMKQALHSLKDYGCFLGIATLKKESFAKEILKDLGLLSYFDVVCGMDEEDRLTKTILIKKCMQRANASQNETVLVGDSEFDAAGAKEAGIDFLAVTYGFGFLHRTPEEFRLKITASMPSEIPTQLHRMKKLKEGEK